MLHALHEWERLRRGQWPMAKLKCGWLMPLQRADYNVV